MKFTVLSLMLVVLGLGCASTEPAARTAARANTKEQGIPDKRCAWLAAHPTDQNLKARIQCARFYGEQQDAKSRSANTSLAHTRCDEILQLPAISETQQIREQCNDRGRKMPIDDVELPR